MFNANDLRAVLSQIPARSQEFAKNLIKADESYGLSQKQAYWVDVLVQQVKDAAAPAPAQSVGDVSAVVAMFAAATSYGAKAPRIRLDGFALSLGKPDSKNPGSIYIKSDSGEYCGKVSPTGEIQLQRSISNELRQSASRVVTEFASDPLAIAAAYGKRTHHCCFCSIKLTDDKSGGSIEMGYGPICAKKFGLAHSANGSVRASEMVVAS